MKQLTAAAMLLRARLFLAARGPVLCGAVLLLAAGIAALGWLLPQRAQHARQHQAAMRLASAPPAAAVTPVASANDNLRLFYDTLGEKRYAEQQVRTLFGLAAKAGLTLSQGEYKSGYDRNARLTTYQVTLPLKGSYADVWKFSLMALRAIPFASLDELSFKRENIGDQQVEARLRLTLYLADKTPGGRP